MPTLTMNRRAAPAAHSDYKKAGHEASPLTLAEERLLGTRFRRHGDERALDLLVQSHLRLAMRVAYEFRHAGPPMEDLIQEAMVGLTIAARRFDPEVACVIHTHARHCVALSMDDEAKREREWLTPLTPYFVMKAGHVPLIPYHRPGDPAARRAVASGAAQLAGLASPLLSAEPSCAEDVLDESISGF